MFELYGDKRSNKIIKLTKNKKENKPIIHSFTLFSALISNYIKIFGKKEFENNKELFKEIKLTSAFPKIDKIFFLPNPKEVEKEKKIFSIPNEIFERDRSLVKLLKKLSFVDFDTFRKWLENNKKGIEIKEDEIKKLGNKIKKGFYSGEGVFPNFEVITELKTMIYRFPKIEKTGEKEEVKTNELFERDVFIFNKNFSFYFLIKIPEEIIEDVKLTLENLEGIGGKRSSGYGNFKVKNITTDYKEIVEFFSKEKEEGVLVNNILLNNKISHLGYTLVEYGGYFDITNDNPQTPKPQLFYLEEGSIVKIKENTKNFEETLKGNKLFIYNNPWVI